MGSTKRKSRAPEELTVEQKRRLWAWVISKYSWLTREQVREQVEACLEFHQAKGNLYVDWVKVCQTWIRKAANEYGSVKPSASVLGAGPASERDREERAYRRREKDRALRGIQKVSDLDRFIAEAKERAGLRSRS